MAAHRRSFSEACGCARARLIGCRYHVRQRGQVVGQVLARALGLPLVAFEQVAPARQFGQQAQDMTHLQRGQAGVEGVQVALEGAAIRLVGLQRPRVQRLLPRGGRIGRVGHSRTPQRLEVSPLQRQRLGALCGVQRSESNTLRMAWFDDSSKRLALIGAVLALVEVGQREVGLDVVVVGVAQRLPVGLRAVQVLQAPLRARHAAQAVPLETLAPQVFGDHAQPALVGGGLGALDLLDEVQRQHCHLGRVGLGQCRQHQEDRAVGLAVAAQARPAASRPAPPAPPRVGHAGT